MYGLAIVCLGAVPLVPGEPPTFPAWLAQSTPRAAYGDGVTLVVWADDRSGPDARLMTGERSQDIFGARVAPDGTILDPAGLRICGAPGNQRSPVVTFDGTHFVVAWTDDRAAFRSTAVATDRHVYFARVTTDGTVLDPDGWKVTPAATLGQQTPSISSAGGVSLIVWQDHRGGAGQPSPGGFSDIVGARVRSNGQVLDPLGITVCGASLLQAAVTSCADGDGGWHVAWRDDRAGLSQVFANSLSAAGVPSWVDGRVVAGVDDGVFDPIVANSELAGPWLGVTATSRSIRGLWFTPSNPSISLPPGLSRSNTWTMSATGGPNGIRVATGERSAQDALFLHTVKRPALTVSTSVTTPGNAREGTYVETPGDTGQAAWEDYRAEGALAWWQVSLGDVYHSPTAFSGLLQFAGGQLLSQSARSHVDLEAARLSSGTVAVQFAECSGVGCDLQLMDLGGGPRPSLGRVQDHGLVIANGVPVSVRRSDMLLSARSDAGARLIGILNNQTRPILTVGDLVLWFDHRPSANVFAESVDVTGAPRFATDAGGRELLTAPYMVQHTIARSGPDGGFLYAWLRNDGTDVGLNAVRLRSDLSPFDIFPLDFRPARGQQLDPAVVGVPGGFVLAWVDYRDGGSAVWADVIPASSGFAPSGRPVSASAPYVGHPALVAVPGGVVIAWERYSDAGWDIMGTSVPLDGGPAGLEAVLVRGPDVRSPVWLPTQPPSLAFTRFMPSMGVFRYWVEAQLFDAGVVDAGAQVDAGTVDAGSSGGSDAGSSDAGPSDAGLFDAGTSDAGTSDAGTSDAGTSDAGTSDAGTSDAGTSDAGTSDAGSFDEDGGVDGGSGPSDAGLDGGVITGPASYVIGCGCQTGVVPPLLAGLLLLLCPPRKRRLKYRE